MIKKTRVFSAVVFVHVPEYEQKGPKRWELSLYPEEKDFKMSKYQRKNEDNKPGNVSKISRPPLLEPRENYDRKARRLSELFKGRISEDEARVVLEMKEWVLNDAVNFIFETDAKDLRDLICQGNRANIEALQRDNVLKDLAAQNKVVLAIRQFSCWDCDHTWWRNVPQRKQVSKCRKCLKYYDPVPRESEWGWAIFRCECGRDFSGYGQMGGLKSKCLYERGGCGRMVSPHEIRPPARGQGRRSRTSHTCDGYNCYNRHAHDDDESDGYHDYIAVHSRRKGLRSNPQPGPRPQHRCTHPLSSPGKRKVLVASRTHHSTGSTVATFLTQDDIGSVTSFVPNLASIGEDGE